MELKLRDIAFFVFFILFFILALLVPDYGPPDDTTKTIFGAATFFFSIFTGFSIAKLNGRQSIIKSSSMQEASALMSLYNFSLAFSKKVSKKVSLAIDNYLIKVLILPYKLYHLADSEFNKIFLLLEDIKVKTQKQSELFSAICYEIRQFSDARAVLNLAFLSGLSKRIKFLQYILGIFLIVLIFAMKESNPLSILITTIFPSAILLVFMYLHELETFQRGEYKILFMHYERIFDLIEKPRFYHYLVLDKRIIKLEQGRTYRIMDNSGKIKKINV